MPRTKLSALARTLTLVASVGAPCFAHAADLLPPEPPPPEAVEIGGAWYLRGDVGVGAAYLDDIAIRIPGGTIPDTYRIDQRAISDQFFAGGGVGYQFNYFLRGDITAEYRGGGKITANDSFDRENNLGKGINAYDGNVSSLVFMASGYVDVGTWYGITPFVGAGVGYAYHHLTNFRDMAFGANSPGFGISKDRYTGSFAWAAMAGLGYSITPNLQLELGYRYINLGSFESNGVNCYNSGCEIPAHYKFKDLTSHDVRLGMRWLLGAPAPVAEYVPPLVRKY